jgi:hypothetical protein
MCQTGRSCSAQCIGPLHRVFIDSWLTVSSFAFLECLALTEDTVGFFWVWIGIRAVAAVSSVQRLRMSANANFIVDHVTLTASVCRRG